MTYISVQHRPELPHRLPGDLYVRPHVLESPCEDACPVHLKCHAYISLTTEGQFEKAYRAIRQRLPFPRTLGRICDAPCEVVCRRILVDEPVAIRDLKRFIADWSHEKGIKYRPLVKSNREERVAIVGAGAAGLAAAYDLAREGFSVTVFEALPIAGGMAAVGCPEYKLPKEVLESDIENITQLGVEIKLNSKITDVDSLFQQGYKAVLLAPGAHQGQKVPIPGADLNDVLVGVAFLRDVNLGKKMTVGKKVIVVGGGDVACDCARTAIRLGAEEVTMVCLEYRDKMPAHASQKAAAEEEGVTICPSQTITRILSENQRVRGVQCFNVCSMEFDKEGKLHFDTEKGSEHFFPADMVIFAIGQLPDLCFISKTGSLEVTKRGFLQADVDTLATNIPGVFVAGDAVKNAGSFIQAVSDGQRAALSITSYLKGEQPSPTALREDDEDVILSRLIPSDEEIMAKTSRTVMSSLPVEQRKTSFGEVRCGYSAEEATGEAFRCIRCDLTVQVMGGGRVNGLLIGAPGSAERVQEEKDLRKTTMERASLVAKEGSSVTSGNMRLALIGGLELRLKPEPKKVDEVVYVGCAVWGTPYPLISFCRVLEYFGVQYALLRHEECCGAPLFRLAAASGSREDKEKALAIGKLWHGNNIKQAKDMGAKSINYMCTWCAYVAERLYGDDPAVKNRYHGDIMIRLIEEHNPPMRFDATVAYFEGGHHRKVVYVGGARDYEWSSYRRILDRIEGLKVIDLPNLCCVTRPDATTDAIEKLGVKTLVTPCTTCYGRFMRRCPQDVRVLSLADILWEALVPEGRLVPLHGQRYGKTDSSR